MRALTVSATLMLLSFAATSVTRGQDLEGSKDHPMLSRMPGYIITGDNAQDLSVADLPTDPAIHVEGKYWRIEYGLPEGGKKIWVEIDVNNQGDQYTLTVVEEAAMEQKVHFTEMELANALNAAGAFAVYGILFDTGKSTIKTESADVLATIGAVLKQQSALKLEIQGHTDNVGSAAANLKLSQDRAAAAKAYLVQTFAIAADRLTTVGLGDTKPLAPNTTDEARAKNRRVELLKK